MNEKEYIIELEKHPTKDIKDNHVNGSLTVIWRDWDKIIEKEPKMVYTSSVNKGEIKGPHIHTKRNSHFVCIHGKVIFVIKHENEYLEIESSEKNPVMVFIPKGVASAHINISNESSTVLALADIAWKPNDNEMHNTTFDDYDWEKFKHD
tara:strand:+ start:132 stop:581 length:450 start_codon:yes stop_codon:yes gene_type:complete